MVVVREKVKEILNERREEITYLSEKGKRELKGGGANLRYLCEKCNELENKCVMDNGEIVICVKND